MSQNVKKKKKMSPVKAAILRRVKVLYLFFFLLGLLIIGRIIWLQTGTDSDQLRNLSQRYSYRTDVVEAARGNIYSDDGRVLTISIPYYELRMDMRAGGLTEELFRQNVDSLSICLAEFFKDKNSAQYRDELKKAHQEGKRYHLINRRKINYLDLQRVKKFPLFRLGSNKGGFIYVENNRRMKPYGELAGRTIGFVNQSGVKVGIEGAFDEPLSGTSGLVVKQKVAGDFWTPIVSPYNVDPVDGVDVVSTINIEMQDMVQKSLEEWVLEAEADWGCVMVMEVATGDVKAMANVTRRTDGTLVEDYNYAIGMGMEPGSTFKLAALIALLEDAKMSLSTEINTGHGVEQIGPVKVVDATRWGYGTLSLQGVFEKSSNIGMAKAVNMHYQNNPAKFVNAINKLGIHKPLDIQLPGEARPLVKHPGMKNGWDRMTLTMMSYGYAVRLAPIHTLALYNAVANDGVFVKPMFVREIRKQDKVLARYPTDTINPRICSPQTVRGVQQALEGVVVNGTGRALQNPNYRLAVKTGTAQVAMGRSGYTTRSGGRHYLGSMVGYMPADKPRYSVVVALKTYHPAGSNKPYYGTQLAGPLFKTVADRIYTMSHNFTGTLKLGAQSFDPELKALPGSSAELEMLMKELRVVGAPRTGEQEKVSLEGGKLLKAETVSLTAGVPDLYGLKLDDALALLESLGLKARFMGMGTVVGQSKEAGEPFEPGQVIEVVLGNAKKKVKSDDTDS